jgi:hypothetical protein
MAPGRVTTAGHGGGSGGPVHQISLVPRFWSFPCMSGHTRDTFKRFSNHFLVISSPFSQRALHSATRRTSILGHFTLLPLPILRLFAGASRIFFSSRLQSRSCDSVNPINEATPRRESFFKTISASHLSVTPLRCPQNPTLEVSFPVLYFAASQSLLVPPV